MGHYGDGCGVMQHLSRCPAILIGSVIAGLDPAIQET